MNEGEQKTHGLDRERHTGLHGADRLVFRIVRDVGCSMEQVVDAMPTVRTHNGASSGPSDRFAALNKYSCPLTDRRGCVHDFSEVAEECAWLADFDRLVEGFTGHFDELLRVVVDTSDRVRLVQVCVEAYRNISLIVWKINGC